VELLVSIGIIVLVLTIVLTQQSAFNSSVLLRSQAYDVALAIRQVQAAAVSSESDGSGNFRTVLGLHFAEDDPQNRSYPVFADSDGDYYYQPAELSGLQPGLDPRFEIREIRPSSGSLPADNALSVVFERPNFDARFFTSTGELSTASVQIDIGVAGESGTACGDDVRTVEVTSTGQVAVLECP